MELTLRKQEETDKEFKKALQNPLKPQSTEPGPEMKEYLDKLNSGELIKEKQKEKEAEKEKYIPYCPHCRRPKLRRTPQREYICDFCGRTCVAPMMMAREEKEKEETET